MKRLHILEQMEKLHCLGHRQTLVIKMPDEAELTAYVPLAQFDVSFHHANFIRQCHRRQRHCQRAVPPGLHRGCTVSRPGTPRGLFKCSRRRTRVRDVQRPA